MDWLSLVVGAGIGGVVGIALQDVLFPSAVRRWKARRTRAFYEKANETWTRIERLHPSLVLVQAGWDADGCFPDGSVVLRLGNRFVLDDASATAFRDAHADEWLAAGQTDGEQVGVAEILNTRTSDEPSAELDGNAHTLTLRMHRYNYFDFLATHILRVNGTEHEREVLDELAGPASQARPASGFPTPFSVGLTVLCEGGTQLVLPRRSFANGYWASGKVFNAVGEMATVRDFAVATRRPSESTPTLIAKRGLLEELGLSDDEIETASLRMHSFAWSSDVRDFLFFGFVTTSLSRAEVQDRWRLAPDRSETAGVELAFWPVETAADCRKLVAAIRENNADWSSEAAFCTLRSLVTLRRISTDDVRREVGR